MMHFTFHLNWGSELVLMNHLNWPSVNSRFQPHSHCGISIDKLKKQHHHQPLPNSKLSKKKDNHTQQQWSVPSICAMPSKVFDEAWAWTKSIKTWIPRPPGNGPKFLQEMFPKKGRRSGHFWVIFGLWIQILLPKKRGFASPFGVVLVWKEKMEDFKGHSLKKKEQGFSSLAVQLREYSLRVNLYWSEQIMRYTVYI